MRPWHCKLYNRTLSPCPNQDVTWVLYYLVLWGMRIMSSSILCGALGMWMMSCSILCGALGMWIMSSSILCGALGMRIMSCSILCGALGYVDNVVLFSSNITDCNDLLRICSQFATEYDVKFNSTKRMLCFGNTLYDLWMGLQRYERFW